MVHDSGVARETAMDLVPATIRQAMAQLEAEDEAERAAGTPTAQRLRSIAPDVGALLLTLALAIDAKTIVEIGTSGGYSTLWLAVAVTRTGGRVTTFEVDPAKVERARRTFAAAGVEAAVELRHEDGGDGLTGFEGRADLVFIDSEKADYVRLLEPAVAALRPGGLFVADNLVSHEVDLVAFRAAALAEPRLSGLVVPLGGGELVAVRL
jgi:predicted O-methyltransferase YrrM